VTNVHCTISGPCTHYAKVGNASFPAWRMPNGDEVIDLRTSTHSKGQLAGPRSTAEGQCEDEMSDRLAINESFLRVAGVPEGVIAAAKTSEPEVGFVCVTGAVS
jgi:hypothetical protein